MFSKKINNQEGVLEQNPSKQGLKLELLNIYDGNGNPVLEQNPSKQGLKLVQTDKKRRIKGRFRAKSIKTRIETFQVFLDNYCIFEF